MAISISRDEQAVIVQFLGDRPAYERCLASSGIESEPEPGYGLSGAERLAIWIYTSTDEDWYNRINGELWGACGAAVTAFADLLNTALAKIPPCNHHVYRGYNVSDLDAFLATYGVGDLIRWPGFTSSTLDPAKAFAGNVFFTIRSQKGRILGNYADKPFEEEVLFPSGCRFLVLFVERREGDALIELEERP